MSKIVVFIQTHGRAGVLEAELPPVSTLGALHAVLEAAGVKLDTETFIFIDDAESQVCGARQDPIHGLKHGCRIHVTRCKRIKATVQYLEKTTNHEFPPGARVRAVKAWAVSQFELKPQDAAEHVLQLCRSQDRPASDTPLHQLLAGHNDDGCHGRGHHCTLCFDLVPDKRVEG